MVRRLTPEERLEHRRETERKKDEWYVSHGLCPYCSGQHRLGKHGRYCNECYDKQRMYCLDRRDRRIEQGQCTRCGQPYFGPYLSCDDCRKKIRDRAYMREVHQHFDKRTNESRKNEGQQG